MTGKVKTHKLSIIIESLTATQCGGQYKKRLSELPPLGFILGAVLQGMAECLCNWYILQHYFYLWEVATGILEFSMSKIPSRRLATIRRCVSNGTECSTGARVRWCGCNTLRVTVVCAAWCLWCMVTSRKCTVRICYWHILCLLTWWVMKEKVFPNA